MKDHITRYAEILRNIEAIANQEGLPQLASLAGGKAKELEDYKTRQQPYQYKQKPTTNDAQL